MTLETGEGLPYPAFTFFQLSDCVAFHTAWEKKKRTPAVNGPASLPACSGFLPLTIHLYNPFVEDGDVLTFLARYCETVKGGERLKDRFGIWTGKRRYLSSCVQTDHHHHHQVV